MRTDHDQGLPRRPRTRPTNTAEPLRFDRNVRAHYSPRPPFRSHGAHGCFGLSRRSPFRGRGPRSREEAACAGCRVRRHPFPAFLRQSRSRIACRRDREIALAQRVRYGRGPKPPNKPKKRTPRAGPPPPIGCTLPPLPLLFNLNNALTNPTVTPLPLI